MRFLSALVLFVLAACATAAPSRPEGIAGTYRLAELNGTPLPARSPAEPNVTVDRAELELSPDGRFALRIGARVDGAPADTTPVVTGTYRVEGGLLSLVPDQDPEDGPAEYTILSRDGGLRLRDVRGDVWLFTRT